MNELNDAEAAFENLKGIGATHGQVKDPIGGVNGKWKPKECGNFIRGGKLGRGTPHFFFFLAFNLALAIL